ncbi:MAG: hypothetical protein OTI36_09495 [Beijerinckiaceae bacterium]|nr:hypothetical protein [Beijerinckiaceae bacterium]
MNKPLDDAILHIITTESGSHDPERLLFELQRDFVKGENLGLFLPRELEDYCKERNPGVEYIIILGLVLNVFDDNQNLIDVLARLIDQDWHFAHEDIVSALEMIGGDETLSALEGAAHARPHYLARVDGAAALTREAIWAIWKVQTLRALRPLEKLSHDEDCTISALAKKQLRRKMNLGGEGSSADETQA